MRTRCLTCACARCPVRASGLCLRVPNTRTCGRPWPTVAGGRWRRLRAVYARSDYDVRLSLLESSNCSRLIYVVCGQTPSRRCRTFKSINPGHPNVCPVCRWQEDSVLDG
ncbi:hypothetical protein B0H10DRAFT_1148201 [Mycena sp. CBHHK59/15]|nr:hypothetical protein B0H10DRAFT_1148201 [Mycena sp. CBHHK59/15]